MKKKDVSESGAPIIRHTDTPRRFDEVASSEDCDIISEHIEKYVGPIESVFHELVSDCIHLDLNWVAPTDTHPYHVLLTMGMSARPMQIPPGLEQYAYAELFLMLPPTWPMTSEDFKDERHYWPIRLLKFLARFPHYYNTWLALGHTVPNGNPPIPYASNTAFCCALILYPIPLPVEFFELQVSPQKVIHFFSVVPLYADEMEFKLRHGCEALEELLEQYDVTSLVDIHRPSVVTGKQPT